MVRFTPENIDDRESAREDSSIDYQAQLIPSITGLYEKGWKIIL